MRTIHYSLIILALSALPGMYLKAQNISGMEIPMAPGYDVTFKFHSRIETYKFPRENSQTLFEIQMIQSKNNYTFTISAKKEHFEATTLIINEGNNVHTFILVYKKELNSDDLFHDLSDSKELARRVKELNEKKAAIKNNFSNTGAVNSGNTVTPNIAANTGKSEEYNMLMQAGNKALAAENFDEAEIKFKQAGAIYLNDKPSQDMLAETQRRKTDKEKQNKQDQENQYNTAIKNANDAYRNEKYDDAEKLYIAARTLKPQESWPNEQLQRIEKARAELKKKEEDKQIEALYQSYINAGDKAMAVNAFDEAKAAYKQALGIKNGDALAQIKINQAEKKIEEIKNQEQYRKQEEQFNVYMKIGNDAFTKEAYDESAAAYNEALKIKPGNAEANKQLEKIRTALDKKAEEKKQQEKIKATEEQYQATITVADNAFEAGIYSIAVENYKKAGDIKPGESYPGKKIIEINKLIAKQAEEKNKQQKDSAIASQYTAAIEKGEKALATEDFTYALTAFQFAGSLKPDDQYPKNKIEEIHIKQDALAAAKKAEEDKKAKEAQADKQYKFSMSQANAAYLRGDYETAKKYYNEAITIKQNDEQAVIKLADVNDKLQQIAKQTEDSIKYETNMAMGDSLAFVVKDFAQSIKFYQAAANLKPQEKYPKDRINYAMQQLKIDSTSIKLSFEKEKFTKGMDAYANANKALKALKYEEALAGYEEFMNMKLDTTVLNTNQYNQAQFQKYARDKINDIKEYLARTKAKDSTNNAAKDSGSVKLPDTISGKATLPAGNATSNNAGTDVLYYSDQKEIQTYYAKEIYPKYPSINFNTYPEEQMFDSADYSKENNLLAKEMLDRKPQLNLQKNSQNITITCQEISLNEKYACIKLLIRNNNSVEFLVGPMQIIWHRKANQDFNLYPSYISEFPIILPGKEKTIVYLTKKVAVNGDDSFVFEMTDRLKKIKVNLTIPGDVYGKY